ncbi:MAG: prephenate dehydratase [Clostridiales bacterium]|jgi:prephenate dehydratase|nr:prephenate dehydratase [Clostridiales bacterium]
MKIGYLGPPGTFTQQAAMTFGEIIVPSDPRELIDYPSIEDALRAAADGKADIAAVPLENSTEGAVNATIDLLIFDYDLHIQRELVLPISQCLLRRREFVHMPRVEKIYSHSQSLAQCRKYLHAHYPSAELIPMTSNAEAARLVERAGENAEPIAAAIAAIGPALAADVYHLAIAAENIQDEANNATAFVALSEKRSGLTAGGKATIAFSTVNRPGSLYKILDIFALWDINMTKIVSRPMKNHPGEYVFYVDLEDYQTKDLADALTLVQRKTNFYKYLGSYFR